MVVLLLSVWQACAWLNGGDYTKEFEKCTGVVSNELSQGMYEQQCTDLLIPLDKSHQRIGNFTDSQMNYITGLFRKMFTEMQAGGNRVRRHANTWRYRQEIRSYNGAPFARYAKAVVAAKQVSHSVNTDLSKYINSIILFDNLSESVEYLIIAKKFQ